jgi:peptide deformylase
MAILPIIWAPDPRLKSISEPVPAVDDGVLQLMNDMLDTMYAEPGIGLSAIQVGIPKRIVVVDVARDGEEPQPLRLINPVITGESDDIAVFDEGCLSLPEFFADIERPAEVEVAYTDDAGKDQTLRADDILSRCLQHEIDHLDGILFVDHLSAVRRGMILRKLSKLKKSNERENA